jgi:hypothetical protein
MTYRQKVHTLANQIGALIRIDQSPELPFEVTVEAPVGKVWSTTGDIHTLVGVQVQRGNEWSKEPLWRDLHERMEHGLQACEIVDCDWCRDSEESEKIQETRGETP